MSSALFGTSSQAASKNLVEFRAGKMSMSGRTVTADKRRGLVYLYQSDEGLVHFCWRDRKTAAVETDLLIFPDDCEFKRVTQCTTGRVYLLQFKYNSRKLFFWMQEPKTDKDEEYCSRVNDLLNNPPVPGSGRSNVSTPSALPSDFSGLMSAESELQSLLSGMSQQQLISLLSGSGGSTVGLSSLLGNRRGGSTRIRNFASSSSAPATAPSAEPNNEGATSAAPGGASAPATDPAAGAIKVSDLRSILSTMNVPESEGGGSASGSGTSETTNVDLSTAATAETLQPVLSDPQFLQRLQQFLPSINNSEQLPAADQLRGTLQSPHFQQALSVFSSALQSGQLAPLIRQFELGDEAIAAAAAGNMEHFVRALQNRNEQKKEDAPSSEQQDSDMQ